MRVINNKHVIMSERKTLFYTEWMAPSNGFDAHTKIFAIKKISTKIDNEVYVM